MAHSPEAISLAIGIALGVVAERAGDSPSGRHAKTLLARHVERERAKATAREAA